MNRMDLMSPRVSVITATRTRPEVLRHALASIPAQALTDLFDGWMREAFLNSVERVLLSPEASAVRI